MTEQPLIPRSLECRGIYELSERRKHLEAGIDEARLVIEEASAEIDFIDQIISERK